MPHKAPILNVPRSIREDVPNSCDQSPCFDETDETHDADEFDEDDLIFGAMDDEQPSKLHPMDQRSPSTDEGIHLHHDKERVVKRERANSSISTIDDEWDHILPITEGDGLTSSYHHLQSIQEASTIEPIIGMSNFRVKHRLRRRSRQSTISRWRDAIKKVVQLKDPW